MKKIGSRIDVWKVGVELPTALICDIRGARLLPSDRCSRTKPRHRCSRNGLQEEQRPNERSMAETANPQRQAYRHGKSQQGCSPANQKLVSVVTSIACFPAMSNILLVKSVDEQYFAHQRQLPTNGKHYTDQGFDEPTAYGISLW